MFCPKCGAENKDDSRFCLKCGHKFSTTNRPAAPVDRTKVMPRIRMNRPVAQEPQVVPKPHVSPNPAPPARMERPAAGSSAFRYLLAGLGLVLGVLMFMPWVEVDVPFLEGVPSASIPRIVMLALSSADYIGSLGISQAEKAVFAMDVCGGVLAFFWLVAFILLCIGVYNDLRGNRHVHAGFLACAFLAAFIIGGIPAFKTILMDQMSSDLGFLQATIDDVLRVGPFALATFALGSVAFVASLIVSDRG